MTAMAKILRPQLPCAKATYRRRRRQVAKVLAALDDGPAAAVFFARDGHDAAADWQTCVGGWRQDAWFAWVCGCNEDNAALVISPDGRSELFLTAGDPQRVVWDGPRLAPSPTLARHFGVDACRPMSELKGAIEAQAAAQEHRLALLWRKQEPGPQTAQAKTWRRRLRGIHC